jgi:hypothetical protein
VIDSADSLGAVFTVEATRSGGSSEARSLSNGAQRTNAVASGNNEVITMTSPSAETWCLTAYDHSTYATVTLTATW